MGLFGIFILACIVLIIASFWVVFIKAGKPGWACIVPIYNLIVLLEIAGKPLWWILLMLIPLVNIVIAILVAIAVAKNFGKSAGFGIGLAFLPFIFYPVLAWGDSQYQPQPA
ncbi:MAG: signal peptidase I [Acidobacteria bacterium]|nr:signal peptidase I [Acidobacteriota bacterium]